MKNIYTFIKKNGGGGGRPPVPMGATPMVMLINFALCVVNNALYNALHSTPTLYKVLYSCIMKCIQCTLQIVPIITSHQSLSPMYILQNAN